MPKYKTLKTITHLNDRVEAGQVVELTEDQAASWGTSYVSEIVESESIMNEFQDENTNQTATENTEAAPAAETSTEVTEPVVENEAAIEPATDGGEVAEQATETATENTEA
jgi:hypothetical protein